jgi:hypothetical protein
MEKSNKSYIGVFFQAGVFAVVVTRGFSQEAPTNAHLTSDQLNERTIYRRAIEAVIWGMPAVNTDLMIQEMLSKTKGKINEVLYWSHPADSTNQTLTPNPDSIYFMCFYNTKEVGPMAIDVPPADTGSFAANIVNVWQMPLEDAGPEGADKGKGGKYRILPSDYKDNAPEGYIVLQSDTYSGYALSRSNLVSHSDTDIEKSVAYGKCVKVYSLAQARLISGNGKRSSVPPGKGVIAARDDLIESGTPHRPDRALSA